MKCLLDKIEADFENKLIHSVVLKWILIIGGTISLSIVGMIIYNYWGAELCKPVFSGECLNNFSNNMQLPAKLITATLALSGFWALIFRSHQTTEQIVTSQKQTQLTIDNNTFNNYVSHKSAFTKMLEHFESEYECRVIDKPGLYRTIFPNNSPMHMTFEGYMEELDECYDIYERDKSELLKNDNSCDDYTLITHQELQDIVHHWDGFLESLFLQHLRFSNLLYTELVTKSGDRAILPKYPLDILHTPYYLYQQLHNFSTNREFTRDSPSISDQIVTNKLSNHYKYMKFTTKSDN